MGEDGYVKTAQPARPEIRRDHIFADVEAVVLIDGSEAA
jgi:hypothetical protein